MRLLALVSSSPSITSNKRSYHCRCEVSEYCGGADGAELKAFGAKDADVSGNMGEFVELDGRCGRGGVCCEYGIGCCNSAVASDATFVFSGRLMFAVGGGGRPVLCGGDRFELSFAPDFRFSADDGALLGVEGCVGAAPYF